MKRVLLFVLCLWPSLAAAQWQVPTNTIPYGKGAGKVGFGSITNSGAGSSCLLNTSPPTFGPCSSGTTLTPGSVVFAGPSGVLSQDNANFFWKDDTNRLGLGTVSPYTQFDVLLTNAAVPFWPDGIQPSLSSFYGGNSSARIATTAPLVHMSKYDGVSGVNTTGGQNAALVVAVDATNAGPTAITQSQGITSKVTQRAGGIGDVVGFFSIVQQHSATPGVSTGYNYFGSVEAGASGVHAPGTGALGYQQGVNNYAQDNALGDANAWTGGIDLAFGGAFRSTFGIWLRNNGAAVDAGYVALAGSVRTYAFIDQSSAITAFAARGTNTNAFDATGATISGCEFKGTGFCVSPAGVADSAGYKVAGAAGITAVKTVRAAGGAADCTLTFTSGILTATTC